MSNSKKLQVRIDNYAYGVWFETIELNPYEETVRIYDHILQKEQMFIDDGNFQYREVGQKSCSYCVGEEPKTSMEIHCDNSIDLDLFISGNRISANYIAYSIDSSFEAYVEINYCPMCGRKLLEREAE